MERHLGMDVQKVSCSFCALDASGHLPRRSGGVTWKPFTVGGQVYYWGYLAGQDYPGGIRGIGGIRFRHNHASCTNSPWCFPINGLEVFSGNKWVTVPQCDYSASPSTPLNQRYAFCLTQDGNPSGPVLHWDIIQGHGHFPSLHRLSRFGNKHELWSHDNAVAQDCGCYEAGAGGAVEILYREFFPPLPWRRGHKISWLQPKCWPKTPRRARCQPGGRKQSRFAPFRLEWTVNILYSRTTDNPTNPLTCPNVNHYVVRTYLGEQ